MVRGEWVRDVSIALASLAIAVATSVYTVRSAAEERNAKLVEIGVSVLRIDPKKEGQISAARKWALDLIDANGGGVKFSAEAREELLHAPLRYDSGYTAYDYPEEPLPPR
jgi:hypothetical protein